MSRVPTTEPEPDAPLFTLEGSSYHLVRRLETLGGAQRLIARRVSSRGIEGFVVIKQPSPRALLDQRRRLAHEAWVARRLAHPGLPRVLHAEVSQPRPLLITEYVEGVRLERVLTWAVRRGVHLSAPGAAFIAAEVADALAHAHGVLDEGGYPLRLVYRDVSPANITLSPLGEVKLADLGSVLTCGPYRVRTPAHTLRGSVGYAAPEVLRLERPDARADVFSLGLVLVEMLTGVHLLDPPYQRGLVAVRGVFRKLLGKIWTEQPVWEDPAKLAAQACRLRPEDVAKVTRRVPTPLQAVAQRALRVDPAERYATAADMRDELRAYVTSTHPAFEPEQLLAEVRKLSTPPRGDRNPVDPSWESLPAGFRQLPPRRS
ncbi:MAG TPA: serine/threonine-protein kinase [Myxococcaceae bacterium]|nr:serine/threonine-protein kinase [Myxococcaceae bacterium]